MAIIARTELNECFSPDFPKLKSFLQGNGKPDELFFFEWYIDPGEAVAAAGKYFDAPDYTNNEDYDFECNVRLAKLLMLHNLPYCACQKILHMIPKSDISQPAGDFGARDIAWNDICTGPFDVGSPFEMVDWQGGISLASHRYLENAYDRLPDGMKLSVGLPGVMEIASAILGNEQFYLGMCCDPVWVGNFLRLIGEATVKSAKEIVTYPAVGCLVIADDMGSGTGLLVSPTFLRNHVIPYHQRCVEIAHHQDIPVVLHSCGNIMEIVEDELSVAGIDAKQSFDDIALPVERFKSECGSRVVTLGGVDMNIMSSSDPISVRTRVREIMKSCWGDGRYAMGSGHCVAAYTPIENFLAMQNEARQIAEA